MSASSRHNAKPGSRVLRNFGYIAMPLLVVVWSLVDLTLGKELVDWIPYLASGFSMNVLITICAVTFGTAAGVLIGLMQLATYFPIGIFI